MPIVVTSFYVRVEMDWDHRDDEGLPRMQVQDDGLHALASTRLVEVVGQLIAAALAGDGTARHDVAAGP